MTSTITTSAFDPSPMPMEVDEELHQAFPEEPRDLELTIGSTFSVEDEAGMIEIKQEPQDYVPEPEIAVEDEIFEGAEITDDNLAQVYPEINDSILQRAVSPPSYNDLDEQSIEELTLYYKKLYNLKEVSVLLESCDKIWETLQLIKNIQGDTDEDQNSRPVSPKNSSENQTDLSGLLNTIAPRKRVEYNHLPEYRFSLKNRRKLFHCLTCRKLFSNSQSLRDHASHAHGVFYNPKRIYKIRTDFVPPKTLPMAQVVRNETPKAEVQVSPPLVGVEQPIKTIKPLPELQPIASNASIPQNKDLLSPETKLKTVVVKDKIKCVLCKRICTDIKYHLRVFHKVGCVSSIIDQCEKIPTEYFVNDAGENSELSVQPSSEDSNELPEAIEPHLQSQLQQQQQPKISHEQTQLPQLQQQQKLLQPQPQIEQQPSKLQTEFQGTVRTKKRRRCGTSWTVRRKKINQVYESTILYKSGPFKCNICLGIYKSYKSYSHHRKLHLMRGETPENFNPLVCRFLNSPLRPVKTSNQLELAATGDIPMKEETLNTQTSFTNSFPTEDSNSKAEIPTENLVSQDMNVSSNEDTSVSKSCDCGRTFRKSHTLFLHKVKCKGINEDHSPVNNDADSGLGISIKIKKNKNDSYEVVSSNTIEESCKEIKSSKDSDISSNDSGMASIDSHNQKIDSETPKYNHSFLRIRTDHNDDFEVDVEDIQDENSHQSLLNSETNSPASTSQVHDNSKIASIHSKKGKSSENVPSGVRPVTRRSHIVPTLINLCRQALSKSKQQSNQLTTQKCQTCSMDFENENQLLEHLSTTKHGIISKCACGKSFKNLKYFNIHVKRVHPSLLKCNYCKTIFDRIERYAEHKCQVTEGEIFIEPIIQTQCLVCKELVDLEEPFDKHMKMHNNDATYQCFKCELRFENVNMRKAHFSKEHGFTLCQICGKLLHIEHSSKHEAYHEGLGYPCHLCKKAFTQKMLLKKHVQNIHDPLVNEFVKCMVCSKSMRLKYLKKHMSFHLHTEICRKCNKCYRSDEQKNLDDHIALSHPNDYPAQKCNTCSATFLSDKRYEEHFKDGSCVPNNTLNLAQSATTV